MTVSSAANRSNYLVCDRANTQSVTVRKSGKTLNLLQCPRSGDLQYRPVRRKNEIIKFLSLLGSLYTLFSDVSLRRQAIIVEVELPCSKAMLICSIIWLEADVAGCCSAGSVLR